MGLLSWVGSDPSIWLTPVLRIDSPPQWWGVQLLVEKRKSKKPTCDFSGLTMGNYKSSPWVPHREGCPSCPPGLGTQFSSVQSQSCPTLCDLMDCSTPGLPFHHQLPELVHWVGDAIQPSHPLWFASPPTYNLSQNQGLFQRVSSLHQMAKVLEFQLQHQFFQWIFRTDFL